MPDIFVAKEKKKAKPKAAKPETVADSLKKKRTTNPLAALMIRPHQVSFDTQEREEEIILLVRRHLITNLRWILVAGGMILLPFFVSLIFAELFTNFRYRSVLVLIWYVLTFSYVFEQFLRWFFNVNILTDERVVDIDFPSILYRDISSAKIDNVQDISAKTGGFVRSFFNYGDVYIQTAGEEREFVFEAVPEPEEIVKILNQLILEEEQEKLEGRAR
jgi:uncharacterized membrane protein YdbT with pleckstrin-like domain